MSEVFTYRGICEHGKVRVMIVDDPQWASNTASEVAKCIRRGLSIDRVTVEEARKSDMKCPACDEKHSKNKRRSHGRRLMKQRHWKIVLGSRYLIFRKYKEPQQAKWERGPFHLTFVATMSRFGLEMGLTRWL